jgi:hypothetical protein
MVRKLRLNRLSHGPRIGPQRFAETKGMIGLVVPKLGVVCGYCRLNVLEHTGVARRVGSLDHKLGEDLRNG